VVRLTSKHRLIRETAACDEHQRPIVFEATPRVLRIGTKPDEYYDLTWDDVLNLGRARTSDRRRRPWVKETQ